jgi:hypothetical protein
MGSIQDLELQYYFHPGKGPVKDLYLIRTIILFRVVLDKSRAKEAKATQNLKKVIGCSLYVSIGLWVAMIVSI